MNVVEIEEAVSELASQPFDLGEFVFSFLGFVKCSVLNNIILFQPIVSIDGLKEQFSFVCFRFS